MQIPTPPPASAVLSKILCRDTCGCIPVLLAPMAGITDPAFRRLCIEQGCDFTFTEMVSAKGLHYNNKKTKELIDISPVERPCGVQLFGHEPEIIADTAKRLSEELNADSASSENQKQIAVFDINMGCPAPKITGNGDGSALMRSPALAARIIEAAVRAVSIPVSVKFRLGWDADSINAVEFAKMAESSGAAFVTVHGRTRMQMYSGTADWDKIAEVVNAVRIPVIGNGDVFSGTDAAALAAKTGCAGIMAARGAQGNPFLFAEIRAALRGEDYVPPSARARLDIIMDSPNLRNAPPSARARLDAALRHISEYIAAHGDSAFADMRKHIAWYTKGMYGSTELRRRVNNCGSTAELSELVRRFRDEVSD